MTTFIKYGIVILIIFPVVNEVFQCRGQTSVTYPTTEPTSPDGTSIIPVTQSPGTAETTASPHHVNKYTATNGTVCIVLVANIEFHIKYNATNTVQTANVTIPDVYNTSGDCSYNNNQQRLNISFFNNTWSFSVIIKKDTENLGEEMMPYFWSEIDFNYIVTEELFPDVLPDLIGEEVKIATFYPTGLFHTYGASYRCNGTRTVTLGDSTAEFSQFQYRAFGTTTDDHFSNTDVTECVDSPDTPVKADTVPPIVIAGICAGLLVVMFIVYVLFRQRQHKHY